MYNKVLLKRVSFVSIAVTLLLSLSVILDWTLGTKIFTSLYSNFKPMAPSAAIYFVLISFVLIVSNYKASSLFVLLVSNYKEFHLLIKKLSILTVVIVLLSNILILLLNFMDIELDIDTLFIGSPEVLGNVETGRMSPLTAITFIITSVSLLFTLTQSEITKLIKNIQTGLTTSVLAIGLIVTTSYIYANKSDLIPMALTASLAFISLGVALAARLGENSFFVNFMGSSVKARLLRIFLPSTILIVLISDWARMNINFLYIHPALISPISSLIFLLFLGFVISRISIVIGGDIDRVEVERRKAESDLIESEGKLKQAQEIGRIGSWEFDIVSQKISWSDQTYKLYGRDPALGPPTLEEEANYYSRDQSQILREYVRRAIKEGKEFEYDLESEICGNLKYFSATMKPIKNEYGKVVKLFGTVQDITERKQAEEALKNEMAFTKNVLNTISDTFYVFDPETGNPLFWHNANNKLLSYSDEGMKGMLAASESFFTKESLDSLNIVAKKVLDVGHGNAEVSVRTKDGRYIPMEYDLVLIRDSVGSPAICAIGRDITAHKQAEEKLRESKERYLSIVEDQSELICRWLPEGTLTFINDVYCRYFNKQHEELIGNKFFSFIPKEDHIAMNKHFARLNSSNPIGSIEQRVILPNGDIRWLYWNNRAIIDSKGQVKEFQSVGRDITERKLLEKELINSKEQLRALASRLQNVREEEKLNLSRELHDNVGQILTALQMDISFLEKNIINRNKKINPQIIKKKFSGIAELLNSSIDIIREISTNLRPAILDSFGLIFTIEWYLKEFQKKSGIICNFISEVKKIKLNPHISIVAYRILQEALTNIIRHSQATLVEVRFKKSQSKIILEIKDNGIGISNDALQNVNSLGLSGMRERALSINGDVIFSGLPLNDPLATGGLPLNDPLATGGLPLNDPLATGGLPLN
ncbi:MAG: PAS domain S-box protein, partial [Bacteroidetes bacterium]|nr:PAS domain S-box protein [Bacteroidota bacterium]